MTDPTPSITDLPELVEALRGEGKALFRRLFHLTATTGHLVPPTSMTAWVKENFGSLEAVVNQKIIRVTNLVTMEGTLYNPLRALRPVTAKERLGALAQVIDEAVRLREPIDDPLHKTPEDPFGRVQGRHTITASNVAKYDGLHAILILAEHNPLRFTWEQFDEVFDTAVRWLEKAHSYEPSAKYPFIMWNCLWKAGASLVHSHFQLLLAREMHYARVEALRRAAQAYAQEYRANYFQDLFRVHQALGLGFEGDGTRVVVNLTPVKEREVIVMAQDLGRLLRETLFRILTCYRDQLHTVSFNLAVFAPPLSPVAESWDGFPVTARLVDRGDLTNRASDIGTMELYGSTVVSSDPFDVARRVRKYCTPQKLTTPGKETETVL